MKRFLPLFLLVAGVAGAQQNTPPAQTPPPQTPPPVTPQNGPQNDASRGNAIVGSSGSVDSKKNFGSLVPRRYRSPFLTRTARNVGDVVTIIVSETSTASFNANTSATKKDNTQTGPNSVPLLDFLNVGLLKTLLRPGNTQADSTVAGAGQTAQQGRFSARISAIVKQVFPNGTMLVEGARLVKVNKETQNLVLTGIVRPDDVRSDNTVLSENLAGAEIKSEGIGLIMDRQRRGILTRLLDWLF